MTLNELYYSNRDEFFNKLCNSPIYHLVRALLTDHEKMETSWWINQGPGFWPDAPPKVQHSLTAMGLEIEHD